MHQIEFPLTLSAVKQFIATLLVIAIDTISSLLQNIDSNYFNIGGAAGNFMANQRVFMAIDRLGCVICGKVSTNRCSACKTVPYCSEKCQMSHWLSGHNRNCKGLGVTTLTSHGTNGLRFRAASRISLVPKLDQNKTSPKPREVTCDPEKHTDLLQVLFPYDEFIKYFYWCIPELAPCGLVNCGNSCYANVVLQCLSWTRPLVAYLLKKGHKRECKRDGWCIFCEFQTHVERASLSPIPFSPLNILSRLPNIGGNLSCGRQEDAHELMRSVNVIYLKSIGRQEDAHELQKFTNFRVLIDTMQSACLDEFRGEKLVPPRFQETTLIHYIFGGHLQSRVQCVVCNNVSIKYENIMDLAVEIHGDAVSLEECLSQFTAKEWLEGDNMYKCDRCENYVKACKRLTIQRAPNILTITLKRYKGGNFGKLNKRIIFREGLDLSPYMSEDGGDSDIYKLYAVIVHLDMLNASFFGHYICYIKDFRGNWYRIEDSEVISVSLEYVLSQKAYMLFYSRIHVRPSCIRPEVKNEKETNTSVRECYREEEFLVQRSMVEAMETSSSCASCNGTISDSPYSELVQQSPSSSEPVLPSDFEMVDPMAMDSESKTTCVSHQEDTANGYIESCSELAATSSSSICNNGVKLQ